MSIEIESGIPIPLKQTDGGRTEIYPWTQLEVDQSFFVPLTDRTKKQSLISLASLSGRRLGKRFTGRRVTEEKGEGVRIWRVQ